MIFYDFEVFKYDWLVVTMDTNKKETKVIINSKDELEIFFNENVNEIWCGFNNVRYDQYILKGILCGFNPKKINDYIIVEHNQGWQFSSLFRYNFNFINYDVMASGDRGLKAFEGFMGNDIKESSVPFDIDRPLTDDEIAETIKYCKHDVEQTVQVFIHRKKDFEAHLGLVKLACQGKALDLSLLSRTKPQLTAIILDASRKEHDDEFDISFPQTMRIDKYKGVIEWYQNPENRCYKKGNKSNHFNIDVAGVPHQFGWGGVHGAIPKYHSKGYFINMDVASLYPSLMIQYNLHSRNISNPQKFIDIYNQRLKYKAEKNPLQAPLKLVLNSTYGVLKDVNNALFDPLMSNNVCVHGQLLLLDLMERLEPYCDIIQSNTDGVLVKMPTTVPGALLNNAEELWFNLIDDIAYEWEERTGLKLEFDEYREIYQKDVNNYIVIDAEGHYKSKGGYVKELSELDYDLPIINKALVNYMLHGIPIRRTINECNNLREFQLVSKISNKYTHILYGDEPIKEKCIRIFASKDLSKPGVKKIHAVTGRPAKLTNSPEHCFIWNDNVNGVEVPEYLDRQWYINFANKRLADFGVVQ